MTRPRPLPTLPRTGGDDPPVCVIGLGNLLQCDDGFGPRVVALLEERGGLGPDVELVDAGIAGLHLVRWVVGRRAVVFLDALKPGGRPGALRVFRREALIATPSAGPRVSPHQPDVGEILRLAEIAGEAPETAVLVGVAPATLEQGDVLSPAVEAALPRAARLVAHELARLGVARPARAGRA